MPGGSLHSLLCRCSWYLRFRADDAADRSLFADTYARQADAAPTPQGRLAVACFNGLGPLECAEMNVFLRERFFRVVSAQSGRDLRLPRHGGWADRLKHILTVYRASKDTGRDFRILHTYPFPLDEYLLPASHDWRIDPREVSYDAALCRPCYVRSPRRYPDSRAYEAWRLRRILAGGDACVHVFGRYMAVPEEEFPVLFRELFRPAPALADALGAVRAELGGRYVSAVFRFLHALGDPMDAIFRELPAAGKERLVQTCLQALEGFLREYPAHRILVCSDSAVFLERVRALGDGRLYVIPGRPVHPEQDLSATYAERLRVFTEFLAISRAERVFNVVAPGMYRSGFPLCAALAGGRPDEVRRIPLAP
ncbi:MAG: hypothetical protein IJ729_03480 [Alloprevotella sp.]|nr:hypothetical protein [Alloprevotella sp.]